MLEPSPLLLVFKRENLNREALPNEALCHLKVGADSMGDELSPKIPGLVPHQVISVYTLPQSARRFPCAACANCLAWLRWIENPVDAMNLGQCVAAALVESDRRRAEKLRELGLECPQAGRDDVCHVVDRSIVDRIRCRSIQRQSLRPGMGSS